MGHNEIISGEINISGAWNDMNDEFTHRNDFRLKNLSGTGWNFQMWNRFFGGLCSSYLCQRFPKLIFSMMNFT